MFDPTKIKVGYMVLGTTTLGDFENGIVIDANESLLEVRTTRRTVYDNRSGVYGPTEYNPRNVIMRRDEVEKYYHNGAL
jgi:hypothetical protein